jgi:IS5 family transposase
VFEDRYEAHSYHAAQLKRRSAIEATIGHMKSDGRLDRNFLLGHAGDAINALLVAAAHNLRLILAVLALWRALMLAALNITTAKSETSEHLPKPVASID